MKATVTTVIIVATMALLVFDAPAYAEGKYSSMELSASQLQKELTTECDKDIEWKVDANNDIAVAKSSLTTQTTNEKSVDASDGCQDSCELN